MNNPISDFNHDRRFEHQIRENESLIKSWLSCRFPGLKADVEDIAQEAFLKALNVHKKRPLDDPKTYVFKVARNLAIDFLRRKKVINFKALVEEDESNVVDSMMGIQEEISRKQEFEFLNEAVDSLPKKCRQIITLRKLYGMSHKEIAAKLNISTNTVESQISIGIRKIRDYFKRKDAVTPEKDHLK